MEAEGSRPEARMVNNWVLLHDLATEKQAPVRLGEDLIPKQSSLVRNPMTTVTLT